MKGGAEPVTAVIVGGGHRSFFYGDYSLAHPDELKIVGIADPDPVRRIEAVKRYGVSENRCYETAEELSKAPRFADTVINGTMDKLHVPTSVPLLRLGYDMLLEKPFCLNENEMAELMSAVRENNSRVMVCHVLRYTRFYRTIKEIILSGKLGGIINIQTAEHVSYHHMSTSYVRGKWANEEKCGTSMLLAKTCHDIDIIMWLMNPVLPAAVSSFGSLMQYTPENAPKNAGTRCTLDCPVEKDCIYSARKLYLDRPNRWNFYVWNSVNNDDIPPEEERERLIRYTSPYGRCMFKCDNTVVDHQSVLISFESGATATHNMISGAARDERLIHIIGTKAELFGCFEDDSITVKTLEPATGDGYATESIDTSDSDAIGHGGGDMELVRDFVRFVRTGEKSIACTDIENSLPGHLCVFLADRSRLSGGLVQSFYKP